MTGEGAGTPTTDRVVAIAQTVGLPPRDVEWIEEFVRVGEGAVAVETLCTQICEHEIEVPVTVLREIRELAAAFGVDDSCVEVIARNEADIHE